MNHSAKLIEQLIRYKTLFSLYREMTNRNIVSIIYSTLIRRLWSIHARKLYDIFLFRSSSLTALALQD